MISDYIKARLATEIPGILAATSHLEGGKQVIRVDGKTAIVSPFASDNEVEAGIRLALDKPKQDATVTETDQVPQADAEHVTELPPAAILAEPPAAPAARRPGGFAASLKALVDDAKSSIAQAQADGFAEVQSAVADLHKVKATVKHVTGNMAAGIRGDIADIHAELGQITNDLGE